MSAVANLHMKIVGANAGEIQGESRINKFAGWIEIDDWTWETAYQKPPGGTEHEKEPVPSVLSFSKLMDRASTIMLKAMITGDLLRVTISMDEQVTDDPFGLTIVLEDARLIEYDADFKTGDKQLSVEEKWSLDYREIRFTYKVGGKAAPDARLQRPSWASNDKADGAGGVKASVLKLTDSITIKMELDDIWTTLEQQSKTRPWK
jgi:type VI secretion system Hcp family effector